MARRILLISGLISLLGLSAVAAPQVAKESGDIIEELKLYAKAVGAIHEGYAGETSPRRLFYEAVKGMLGSLGDKHAQFFDPETYELVQMHISGEYAGVGVILEIVKRYPEVKSVKPDGAAAKAGIQVNDRLLEIDGVKMEDMELPEVARMLRGEDATEVKLKIQRGKKKIDAVVKREKIAIESVKDAREISPGIGYIRISDFQGNTGAQVRQTLEKLSPAGLKGLIIDLREDGGGLLDQAVDLASLFLPAGTKIVSVKSKIKEQQKDHAASGAYPVRSEDMVILVNGNSASASEIFSACMQDHKRAVVIGTKTFGKASVQSVVPLDDKTAMKFTTARYVSPLGREIDGIGLMPDEVIERRPEDKIDPQIVRALAVLIEKKN